MKCTNLIAATALLLGLAAPANAAFLTIDGGSFGSIPGGAAVNEFLNPAPTALFGATESLNGYFRAQLSGDAPNGATFTFRFYGAETDYTNQLRVLGAPAITHNGGTAIASDLASPLATYARDLIGGGDGIPVPFSFRTDLGEIDGPFGQVSATSNLYDSDGPNFFLSCDPTGAGTARECDTVYIFLADDRPNHSVDYDDFFVVLSVTPHSVPEPAALALFAPALLGIGPLVRRRRR